jgi:hypothetical protein
MAGSDSGKVIMPRCGLCKPVVFFLNQNYNFRGNKGKDTDDRFQAKKS